MKKIFYKLFALSSLLVVLILAGCTEDITPSLVEISPESLPAPVISAINPPNQALAGVTKVTITGSNFSPVAKNNLVYFNGVPGKILNASSTQLVVIPPVVISDTVLIKIAVIGAEKFSNIVQYKLLPAVEELYPFDPKKGQIPYAITTDNQENLYVSISDLGTKKISQGILTDFAPKGAETFFNSLTFGPNNTIYATRRVKGIMQVQKNITPSTFVSSAQGISDNVIDTDFDQSSNLWAGGSSNSLYRITLSKNVKKFTFNGSVNALRVVDNFLYVAANTDNEEVIWRFPIISADSLGNGEIYFNFTKNVDIFLKIIDIAIAQDGDIYLGTNAVSDPIFIIHPDKSYEILYSGLIKSSVYSLVWGTGNFLYMTNVKDGVNNTVLKINMQKLGSPYYGRQ